MTWSELDVGSVYATHASFVRRVLARHGVRAEDLDDVVQDAFVTIQRALPGFDRRSSTQTWLYSIAWRVASNYRRRRRRQGEVGDVEDVAAHHRVETMADSSFHAKLGELGDEHRDLIALHDVAGVSVSEVAELTGRARATIRAKLAQARKTLGHRLSRAVASGYDAGWFDALAPDLSARLARPERPRFQQRILDGAAVSRLGDLVFMLWRGPSSVAGLEALIEVMVDTVDDHPAGIRLVCVIERTSTPPTRDGRKLMSWGAGKLGPHLRAVAHVIDDPGMMSLAARIMNASFFVGGEPFGLRFFEQVQPAAQWLNQYGATPSSNAIADHVELMRRSLDAQQPRARAEH